MNSSSLMTGRGLAQIVMSHVCSIVGGRCSVATGMYRFAAGVLMTACISLSWSCSSDKSTASSRPDLPSQDYVTECYDKYLKGDYEAYVRDMASCDSMPEEYRQQMMLLFKQHAAEMRRKNGGAVSAAVVRMEAHNDSTLVNVFFNVVYADSSAEEIMVPFIYVADKWRLQ